MGGVAKHTAVPVAPKQTSKMTVDTIAKQNAWYPHTGVNGPNVIMKVSGSFCSSTWRSLWVETCASSAVVSQWFGCNLNC